MKKVLFALASFLLANILFIPSVLALEITVGEELIIPAATVYEDNLLVGGGLVEINGTVNGDVIAGGGYVTINGTITGDLIVGGGSIQLGTEAVVGGDLLAIGGSVEIFGKITGDLTIYSGQLSFYGEGGTLSIDVGQANLNGKITGNAKARAGSLRFGSRSLIAGNLIYASPNEVKFDEGFSVVGETKEEGYYSAEALAEMEAAEEAKTFLESINFNSKLISYLMLLLLGIIFLRFAPYYSTKASKFFADNFWKSLGLGFLALLVTPILVLLLLFTVVGIPLSLILVAGYVITIYLAPLWPSYWLGSLLLKLDKKQILSKHWLRIGALALGLFIYKVLTSVPFVATVVSLVVLCAGMGALLLAKHAVIKEGNSKKII